VTADSPSLCIAGHSPRIAVLQFHSESLELYPYWQSHPWDMAPNTVGPIDCKYARGTGSNRITMRWASGVAGEQIS